MTTPSRLYPPNAQQLTVRLSHGGQPAAVVLGAVGNDNATPITVEYATAWLKTFWDLFSLACVPEVTCVGGILRDVEGPEGNVVEVGAPTPANFGQADGQATVAAASTLIKWSTARGGRSGKGRTFLPGLSETAVNADGRTYAAAHSTLISQKVAAYLAHETWTTFEAKPAVLSFSKGLATPITGGSLAGVVGIQRRRMR